MPSTWSRVTTEISSACARRAGRPCAGGGHRRHHGQRPRSIRSRRSPMPSCGRVGTWLHVDGAYAGSAMIFCWPCRRRAGRLAGGQPVQVAAHPDGLPAAGDERPSELRAAFSLVPEQHARCRGTRSLSEYGPALGRRFPGAEAVGGASRYGRRRPAGAISAAGWRWLRCSRIWRPGLGGTRARWCASAPEGDEARSRALLERVNAGGEISSPRRWAGQQFAAGARCPPPRPISTRRGRSCETCRKRWRVDTHM